MRHQTCMRLIATTKDLLTQLQACLNLKLLLFLSKYYIFEAVVNLIDFGILFLINKINSYIYKRAIKMNNQFLFLMLESSLIASLRVESSIKLFHLNVLFLYLVKRQKIGCFLILLMEIEINIWLKMGEITNNNLSAFPKLAITFSFSYPLSKLLK